MINVSRCGSFIEKTAIIILSIEGVSRQKIHANLWKKGNSSPLSADP
jgi:hypothetical protein